MTLTDRINELVDLLRVRRRLAFDELFAEATNRFDLVITFLALLEMTKLRMTRLFQADYDSGIYIEFTAATQETTEQTGGAGEAAPTEHPPAESYVAETAPATAPPDNDATEIPPPHPSESESVNEPHEDPPT
jgi:segregation and condensation protein A